MLVNDNPYSMILNSKPESILFHCHRTANVLELNSLSKSHNMAGWRVGMVAGSESNINHILKVKSNFDSGMYKPIQEAAIKALQLSEDWYANLNIEYSQRRIKVWELLDRLGCTYDRGVSGMFVWAGIPKEFKSGEDFADFLLYEKGVFATPGSVFGENGRQYIRFSLCASVEIIEEAIESVETHKVVESCE